MLGAGKHEPLIHFSFPYEIINVTKWAGDFGEEDKWADALMRYTWFVLLLVTQERPPRRESSLVFPEWEMKQLPPIVSKSTYRDNMNLPETLK